MAEEEEEEEAILTMMSVLWLGAPVLFPHAQNKWGI